MLSERELARLRADLADLLPDTCDVLRPTTGTDGTAWGGWSQTWGTVGTAVSCRIDPAKLRNVGKGRAAGREASRNYYQLSLEWNQSIEAGDRVTFGSETYEVVLLNEDHALRGVRRAVLANIQGDENIPLVTPELLGTPLGAWYSGYYERSVRALAVKDGRSRRTPDRAAGVSSKTRSTPCARITRPPGMAFGATAQPRC